MLLVHKTGPKIHPAGGELQGWQDHEGSQGHLLGAQACDSVKGEAILPTGVVSSTGVLGHGTPPPPEYGYF